MNDPMPAIRSILGMPEPKHDQIEDLLEKALHAHLPEDALAAAQIATARAIREQTEQLRIANLIALADHAHERFGNYAGWAGGMGTLFSYPEDEGGNMQLRQDIRKALGL
jgi:hypothetical protein